MRTGRLGSAHGTDSFGPASQFLMCAVLICASSQFYLVLIHFSKYDVVINCFCVGRERLFKVLPSVKFAFSK